MSKLLNEKIVDMQSLAAGIFKMTIHSDYIANHAVPGQFVNVKCGDGLNALLRRPISICNVNREEGTLDIVFQIKGVGTELLSQKLPGSEVDLIGPLGNPFLLPEDSRSIAVVGGGIGVFPLLFLLKESKAVQKAAFLGYRSKEWVVLEEDFRKASGILSISTDDGSYGKKGLVTDPLEEYLKTQAPDILYTCGPTPMIKKVMSLSQAYGIRCQVSLEQRMGCGIGACLVCACKTKHGDAWEYSHVCKDGPVFWAEDVILE